MPSDIIIFALVGLTVGVYGTLLGIGGGIILVPILHLFMGFSPEQAVGTSLIVTFFNGASGTVSYLSQKRVIGRIALYFLAGIIPGSLTGVYLNGMAETFVFDYIFVAFLGIIVLMLFLYNFRSKSCEPGGGGLEFNRKRLPLMFPAGVLTGACSAFFGIGGGVINIPIMIFALGLSPYYAVPTSMMIVAGASISGAAFHMMAHDVQLTTALIMSAFAVVGAQAGGRLSLYIKSRYIIYALALSILILIVELLRNASL